MIWTLVILTLIVLGWYRFEGRWDRKLFAARPGRVCENLRPAAANELLHSGKVVQVLDVRSPAEFASGALPGAVNVSLGSADFRDQVARLDKSKPVLVYCAGGYRSRKAVEVLLDQGFESIHHLHRGYHSWRFAA